MPVQACRADGKPGYRFGEAGKCYTYSAGDEAGRKRAKQQAFRQGAAITARTGEALKGLRAAEPVTAAQLQSLFAYDLWDDLRQTILAVVTPLFLDAFLVGAALGAQQRPSGMRAGARSWMDGRARLEAGQRADEPSGGGPLPPGAGGLPMLPFDFEAVQGAAQGVIANYSDEWWTQFSDSTQRSLRGIIARAEAQGMTMPQIIRAVEPLFGPARARAIAVSETTTLLGQGAQETYRRAGFTQWEWRTVNDSLVDPICKDLNRKRFPMSRRFARAHVSCRCWPVPYGRPATPPAIAQMLQGPWV